LQRPTAPAKTLQKTKHTNSNQRKKEGKPRGDRRRIIETEQTTPDENRTQNYQLPIVLHTQMNREIG
jgi:hypothetical protein